MAMLKKQLDEREKQLAAEQEDASAVKNRLRELTKVRHRRVSKTAGLPSETIITHNMDENHSCI